MKKLVFFKYVAVLAGVVLLFVAGCGDKDDDNDNTVVVTPPDLGANGSGEDGDVMTINGIECVLVKNGSFTMGLDAASDYPSATQEVTLTKDYWISKYPITNAQYGKTVEDKNNHPVVNVKYSEADDWAKSKYGRLPTEAQWEFAARGGNKSNGYIYSGSNNLDEVGWYSTGDGTRPVGQKQPNELGIYDMSGNVWERCSDWYGDYSTSAVIDPIGPSTGDDYVQRGGSWGSNATMCRVALRNSIPPAYYPSGLGFRVVFPRD